MQPRDSSSQQGARSPLQRITLRRALVALGFVLVAINVASAIWDIRSDRQRIETRSLRDFSNLTSLLAAQSSASLESFGRSVPDALESFEHLYRRIDLGPGGFITLLSRDGMLVARVPDAPRATGQRIASRELLEAVAKDGRFEGWSVSPVTGERVLVSASAVPGFPLVVLSGASERSVAAPWRSEALFTGLRTLLTSAAMLGLIGLAAWGLGRRERAVQRTWARFRAMIEHSSDGVLLSRGEEGGIFYVSPTFERIFGYSLGDVRGRKPVELLHPDHREEALRMREEIKGSPGMSRTHEFLARHKDGSWRSIEITATNLLHEPTVGALVMNFRDISERKLAEAERLRLEQRLRQAEKMEAVGRLAGGIAHDFNNILGGILGYAEMLVEGTPAGSPLRRYAGNVLAAATRAASLVEQILSYSRSQRAKRSAVELGRVVAETIELVRGSLPEGIRLEAELPKEPISVLGDATQLHQIVMNLATNAVHAIGERGTVSVSVGAAEVLSDRTLSHSLLRAGQYACVSVADTGSGMDAATFARLFEPFFTTKEVGKGTGLGLALVYGIVTDSGGGIDVETRPGAGSRFSIYLPRVDSPLSQPGEAHAPVAQGRGERIMLVEDEEPLVALTSEVLKRLGYEPLAYADGRAALAAFDAAPESVDAVVTDEVMAGLTGTELARELRARRPGLPVILVSGYIGPLMTERALAAGVAEILKKPVQSRELAAALARALSPAVSAVTS